MFDLYTRVIYLSHSKDLGRFHNDIYAGCFRPDASCMARILLSIATLEFESFSYPVRGGLGGSHDLHPRSEDRHS